MTGKDTVCFKNSFSCWNNYVYLFYTGKKLDEKPVSHEAKLEAHGSTSAEAAQQKAGIGKTDFVAKVILKKFMLRYSILLVAGNEARCHNKARSTQ